MSFKEINIRSLSADGVITELMYEIAACRADGVELARFNICSSSSDIAEGEGRKIFSAITRTLKGMKQKGSIQFFATKKSFAEGSTESSFLINKYPSLFASSPAYEEGEEFIYVKL